MTLVMVMVAPRLRKEGLYGMSYDQNEGKKKSQDDEDEIKKEEGQGSADRKIVEADLRMLVAELEDCRG